LGRDGATPLAGVGNDIADALDDVSLLAIAANAEQKRETGRRHRLTIGEKSVSL
jgi:hypothetical protein